MAIRHRLTAAAAVAGVLAIAAPAVHASADTDLAANASASSVGASLTGSQIPVLGGLQAGATATPGDAQIGAGGTGLSDLQAGITAGQDAWRIGMDAWQVGATAGVNGMKAGATAGVAGMQAGANALLDFFGSGRHQAGSAQHR